MPTSAAASSQSSGSQGQKHGQLDAVASMVPDLWSPASHVLPPSQQHARLSSLDLTACCCRVGSNQDMGNPANCCYFAPIVTEALQPGSCRAFTVYLTAGRLEAMRARFYGLRQQGSI